MKAKDIKLNDNNPRVISDEKIQKLKKSINDFEKMMAIRPIVIDENNVILGGNMRFRALQELGYKDIPDEWIKKVDFTEEEKEEFLIKDNISSGEWNWDELRLDWNHEDLKDFGLEFWFPQTEEEFSPTLSPTFSNKEVEEEDFEEVDAKKSKDVIQVEKEKLTTICPDCGHEFKVSL